MIKDVSKLIIGNDTYNLVDEASRSDIDMMTSLITQRTQYKEGEVTLASGWQKYTGSVYANMPLTLRKQGRIVFFAGNVSPTATTTLGASAVEFATIPIEFAPSHFVFQLCQSSGTSFYFLQVNSAGSCMISRLRDVANANSTYTQGTSSMWFPFSVTWII